MIDREKVSNGLNHCFHGQECCGDTECPYYIEHLSDSCCLEDCQENLKADALSLLKKQEAVEPYSMNAERTYGICPKCGKLIYRYGNVEEYHYCGVCGQAVKWNDV